MSWPWTASAIVLLALGVLAGVLWERYQKLKHLRQLARAVLDADKKRGEAIREAEEMKARERLKKARQEAARTLADVSSRTSLRGYVSDRSNGGPGPSGTGPKGRN